MCTQNTLILHDTLQCRELQLPLVQVCLHPALPHQVQYLAPALFRLNIVPCRYSQVY